MYGKKRSYKTGRPEPDKPVSVRWGDGGQGVLPGHGEHPAWGGHTAAGRAGDGKGTEGIAGASGNQAGCGQHGQRR